MHARTLAQSLHLTVGHYLLHPGLQTSSASYVLFVNQIYIFLLPLRPVNH